LYAELQGAYFYANPAGDAALVGHKQGDDEQNDVNNVDWDVKLADDFVINKGDKQHDAYARYHKDGLVDENFGKNAVAKACGRAYHKYAKNGQGNNQAEKDKVK